MLSWLIWKKHENSNSCFLPIFQEAVEGIRPISKIGRRAGKSNAVNDSEEASTNTNLKGKPLQKKQTLPSSDSSATGCKSIKEHFDEDKDDDNQGLKDEAMPSGEAQESVWMVPDDQVVEEWNLGTLDEPKPVRINKNLPTKFKSEAKKVFEEYKDVFAWEHTDLKGVDPKVCQHKIPLMLGC